MWVFFFIHEKATNYLNSTIFKCEYEIPLIHLCLKFIMTIFPHILYYNIVDPIFIVITFSQSNFFLISIFSFNVLRFSNVCIFVGFTFPFSFFFSSYGFLKTAKNIIAEYKKYQKG